MQISCMPSALTPVAFPRARLLWAIFAMVAAAYLIVFLADGRPLIAETLVDAIANTVALASIALLVRTLTIRVPWAASDHWWFIPLHMLAAMAAAVLSLTATAVSKGLFAWPRSGVLRFVWLDGPARHWQLFTVVFVYAAVAGSCYVLQVAAEAREAALLRHEAALARLRARLDPHVLLNTLHSLLEMVRSNDTATEEAIERFGRVVRYASAPRDAANELVSLREEWQHLEDYLYLERLRLGDRLCVELQLDPAAAEVRIPAVSLQPLAENAIVHGLQPRPGAGTLRVSAVRHGETAQIRVTDDGLGTTVPATTGAGSALTMVSARLAAHFGSAAHSQWGAGTDGRGWEVRVQVPAS